MSNNDTAVVQAGAASSSFAMIQQAMSDKSVDPEKLRALLDVRRDWLADEAKQAFSEAVVHFQQECPIIAPKDTANSRPYARMDRIWREIRPYIQKCGLSVTWESVKVVDEVCVVDGHLRHAAGHAEALHYELPMPDAIKGTNKAQRMGSATTYAKRYAICGALGIQIGTDDDGSGDSKQKEMDATDFAELVQEWIEESIDPASPVSGHFVTEKELKDLKGQLWIWCKPNRPETPEDAIAWLKANAEVMPNDVNGEIKGVRFARVQA